MGKPEVPTESVPAEAERSSDWFASWTDAIKLSGENARRQRQSDLDGMTAEDLERFAMSQIEGAIEQLQFRGYTSKFHRGEIINALRAALTRAETASICPRCERALDADGCPFHGWDPVKAQVK